MNSYNLTKEEALQKMKSREEGLKQEEVNEIRAQYGYNELAEGKKKSLVAMFLEQFKDFTVIILIIAALVSLSFGEAKSSITIGVVLILNAILGVVQQLKAESSLESLKNMAAPSAKVIRDGVKVEIPAREVVPGDIVTLDAGDNIPADGRIIESFNLQVMESALTGESTSVEKFSKELHEDKVALGDQINMLFASGLVTYGRGSMVVTGTGMDTEVGKIAGLLRNAEARKTPLQEKLDDFGKKLGIAIMAVCALIFGLSVFRGAPLLDSFMFAVALAVAAVPEALASIVTIVLAVGTKRMAAKHAIIRKLPAVETLGGASVICSDKTGTLTQNKMTVVDNFLFGKEKVDFEKQGLGAHRDLMFISLLCNDSSIGEDGKEIGDPTETALVSFGARYNYIQTNLKQEYKRKQELPFDSDRKLMSTVHYIDDKSLLLTKGAPDVMFSRAKYIRIDDEVKPLTDDLMAELREANEKFSSQALRVLAFGYKEVPEDKIVSIEDEEDLIIVGLLAMIDPPREEVFEAVKKCLSAGIKPVMITGDHKTTAKAIAKNIGILKDEDMALEGKELDEMSESDLNENLEKISVYARVSPEHKIRIVKAWQEKGRIVAMTGDGVNDAPALKQADIGVAMGITGTDVSKDASAMILTDDNFATIVEAVAEGRTVYNNIKRSIQFLLSGNTAGIITVVYAALLGLPNPFSALHLLFINLLTDSLPAIALGLEPFDSTLMKDKPRNPKESIFAGGLDKMIILQGAVIAVGTITAYHIGLKSGGAMMAQTMAFSTLCLSRLVHGFNVRSRKSIFKIGFFSNPFVVYAFLIGAALQIGVLTIPVFRNIFEVTPIGFESFRYVAMLSLMPLVVVEIVKFIYSKTQK